MNEAKMEEIYQDMDSYTKWLKWSEWIDFSVTIVERYNVNIVKVL